MAHMLLLSLAVISISSKYTTTKLHPYVAPSSAVNQYIVKIYHYEITDKWPKQLCHHSHEGVRSIGQPKRHNQPFIQPIFSFKCSFSFIPWLDSNLVVPTLKINLGENYGTWHRIQYMIKTGNVETILDGDLVDCVAINTHTPCTILLWRQKCENCT